VLIKECVSVITVQSFCAATVQADEIIFFHNGRSFMGYLDPQMGEVFFFFFFLIISFHQSI
jgi:hypothetical protein